MTARCKSCKQHWNISIKQHIPSSGYLCPRCTGRLIAKRRSREMREKYQSLGIIKGGQANA